MKTPTKHVQNQSCRIWTLWKPLILWAQKLLSSRSASGERPISSPYTVLNQPTPTNENNEFPSPLSYRLGSFRTQTPDKKCTKISRALVALLLLAGAPAFGQTTTLPFTEHDGLLSVTVSINDAPHQFLLDTGAKGSVISLKIMHLSPEQVTAGHVTGVTGQAPAFWTRLDITIGKTSKTGYFAVAELPSSLKAFDGILGNDVLSTYSRVVIDYKAHRLELMP